MYLAQVSSAWQKQFSSIKHEFLEAVVQRCSVKMVFLESSQNSQENNCAWVSFLIKKETLAQVFSYEFRLLLLHFIILETTAITKTSLSAAIISKKKQLILMRCSLNTNVTTYPPRNNH